MAKPKEKSLHFDGLDLVIEWPAGSVRTGKSKKTGKGWEMPMHAHYGRIKGTMSPDGEDLDFFMNPDPEPGSDVYVVHCMRPGGSTYDEDKIMLGYATKRSAVSAWKQHYAWDPSMFGGCSEFDPEHFRVIAFAARKSKCILGREETVDVLRASIPNSIKTPEEVAKVVSEDTKWQVRSRRTKKIAFDRTFANAEEANAFISQTAAPLMFEAAPSLPSKFQRMLMEGFFKGDLAGILLPEISLDEYVAKAKNAWVIAFFVRNEPNAVPPLVSFCKATPGILDVDASDSDTKAKTSVVYCEIEKDPGNYRMIRRLIKEIAIIAELNMDDLVFTTSLSPKKIPFSDDFLKMFIQKVSTKDKEAE